MNNREMEATQKTKMSVAFFFILHYGFFHLVYFGFLVEFLANGRDFSFTMDVFSILIMGFIFFLNHLFSFWYNKKEFEEKKPNIGKIMLFPYSRIIPMHLTIIFSGIFIVSGSINGFELFSISVLFFLILKTIADLTMHIIEHRGFEN